jgi:MFS family permease
MEKRIGNLRSVFVIGFLLTVALALTGYIDSSFLGLFVDLKIIGLLFSAGSIVSIIFMTYLPYILQKLGVRGVFHLTGLLYLVAILGMLNIKIPIIFGICFIIYIACGYGLYFTIDVMIEAMSKKKDTGITRGIYLAIYNLAYLVGPLLAGIILKNNSFELIYLIAGIFVIMMFLVFIKDLERLDISPAYRKISFKNLIKRFLKSKNLFNVYLTSLMLSFFFS